jgi:hypothetical protein
MCTIHSHVALLDGLGAVDAAWYQSDRWDDAVEIEMEGHFKCTMHAHTSCSARHVDPNRCVARLPHHEPQNGIATVKRLHPVVRWALWRRACVCMRAGRFGSVDIACMQLIIYALLAGQAQQARVLCQQV